MLRYLAVASTLALAISHVQAVAVWGQCGGIGYTGSTQCDAGTHCVYLNDWYSQCQPGDAATTTPTTAPTTPATTPPPPSTTPTVTTPTPTGTGTPPSSSPTALDARFRSKGKLFWGTCADSALLSNSQNAAVIRSSFGGLTPENSMKWDATEPNRGQFNLGGGDTLVNFAKANGKWVRGHTLVWHSQLPGWVGSISDRTTLTTVIQNHATTLVSRWKGSIYAWDVVNEIFEENGSFRSSVFYRVLGESFVTIAFQAARAADPAAKLYINDYNLDSNNAKAQAVVNLVKRVNQSGKIIDGIGTQMHLEANGAGGVGAAITLLASAGVDVAITELDIKGASSNDYLAVLRACLANAQCVSITSWGVSDKDSWRSGNTPLLFDNNYQPKAAYNALIQALA